jgi:hypothetical protein
VDDRGASNRPPHQSGALRFPAEFTFPITAIIRNVVIGGILIAAAIAILVQAGETGTMFALLFGVLGGLIVMRNVPSLLDPEQRKLIVRAECIEIRTGGFQRQFRFSDYGEFRISRGWFGEFLSAQPIETEWHLPPRPDETGKRQRKQPAILAPQPPFGGGAPASLLEWQRLLNELRRGVVEATGLPAQFEAEARWHQADEAKRLSEWRERERSGARAFRLSRSQYLNSRLELWFVCVGVMLAPLVLGYVRTWYCDLDAWISCARIDRDVAKSVAFGALMLGFLILKLGGAWLMVRRARDLNEDLPFWTALLDSFQRRRTPLRRRLSEEDGTVGTNRFGPEPRD